ncbi:MAG: Omp28-related outer membrane protein, partial [Ignavibacteria bacterium]|nr:Omp28-related outer membrane protein [Ignavibacteria bacterium]
MRIRYLVLFFASILLNWQAFAQTPQLRNPVLEYATGTWCQYCPCGHQVIHDQVLPAVPNTICIAYHGPSTSTDPYKDFTGNAIIDALGFNSYPTGIPDRTSLPIDRGQWKATIAARNTLPAPIALAITKNYTAATRVLNISVKATPQASLNGFYLLNVLILENGLVASQTGNVSYGCIGGTNYVHDHVVRAIINSSYAGDTLKNGAWTSSQPVTRTYQYTLPAGYVPENCEIVALAYKNDIALNTSEIQQGVLASVTPVPIAIVSPNGGETFYIGQSKNIMWRTENIQNVKIEYTTNNGTSWSTIVASTPAEQGYYTWTVPSTASTTCKVRISDAANGTVIKESNSTFSISVMPASAWSIIPTSTTGDIWGIDYVDANIVWICANNGDVRRSTDGGQTFLNAGNVGQGAYTIAAINATTAVCALGPSSGAGKITRTTDGGTTWTTVYAPANNWFDFVEKIDANNLW